jgi:hypothetical protein
MTVMAFASKWRSVKNRNTAFIASFAPPCEKMDFTAEAADYRRDDVFFK